ncbi:MAG: hypothetical protein NVSMB47_02040 [Polyangiales bacterium]
MKPCHPTLSRFAAPSLVLVTLAVAGCAVQTEGPASSESSSKTAAGKLTRPTCPPGEHAESTNEGPGGKAIWSCVSDDPTPTWTSPPPGTNPENCYGSLPVPAELAGQGCLDGTYVWVFLPVSPFLIKKVGIPVFMCPSATTVPSTLGFAGSNPTCSPPTLVMDCEKVGSFVSISQSCMADAPSGWKYVTEYFYTELRDEIGAGCGGGCGVINDWPPTP